LKEALGSGDNMNKYELREQTREGATIAIMTGILAPLGIIIWMAEFWDITYRWIKRIKTNGLEGR